MSNIKEKLIDAIRSSGYGYFITHKEADVEECLQNTAASIVEKLPELLADSEWVKLPCKVGDMVWFIIYGGRFGTDINVKPRIVNAISLNRKGVQIHSERDNFVDANLWGYVGDTVFLTQAEAEAELAELTGVNKNE